MWEIVRLRRPLCESELREADSGRMFRRLPFRAEGPCLLLPRDQLGAIPGEVDRGAPKSGPKLRQGRLSENRSKIGVQCPDSDESRCRMRELCRKRRCLRSRRTRVGRPSGKRVPARGFGSLCVRGGRRNAHPHWPSPVDNTLGGAFPVLAARPSMFLRGPPRFSDMSLRHETQSPPQLVPARAPTVGEQPRDQALGMSGGCARWGAPDRRPDIGNPGRSEVSGRKCAPMARGLTINLAELGHTGSGRPKSTPQAADPLRKPHRLPRAPKRSH